MCYDSRQGTLFPGLVMEVGYSDSRRKSRRDVGLWLNNSNCDVFEAPKILLILQTKVGIACKIGVDQAKQINRLTFDVFMFDFNAGTRHSPLGRAKMVHSQVSPALDLG